MKTRLRKGLAILLSLTMVLSLCYIPAFAATADTTITLSLLFNDKTDQSSATDSLSAAKDQTKVYVFVHFDGQPTAEADAVKAGSVCLSFDTAYLQFAKSATLAKFGEGSASSGSIAAEGKYVFGFGGDGIMLTNADEEDEIAASGNIFRLQFTALQAMDNVADHIALTESFVATDDTVKTTYLTDANDVRFPLAGIPMAIGSLELSQSSVTVQGGETAAIDVTPTVKSTGGSAIALSNVDITITKGEDSFDWLKSGVISVPNNAAAGEYTVTAKKSSNAEGVTGGPVTATLTVARAASVAQDFTVAGGPAAAIEIPADGAEAATAPAFTADIKDQFGESKTAEWSITDVKGVSIDVKGVSINENGVVTVTNEAKDAIADSQELTVTATSGEKSSTAKLTVKRAAQELKTIQIAKGEDAITKDTLTIPTSGSKPQEYKLLGIDQYGAPMTVQDSDFNWSFATADDYVSAVNGTVTVQTGASPASYTLTATNKTNNAITASVTIQTVDIEVTFPAVTVKADATYGDKWSDILTLGTDGSAKLEGQDVTGKFDLVYDANGTASTVGKDAMPNAGEHSYDVVFQSDDGNYTVYQAKGNKVSVKPRTMTVDWEKKTLTYTGSELALPTATITGVDGTTKITLVVTEKNNAVVKDARDESAPYTAQASLVPGTPEAQNYALDAATATTTFTVAPKAITPTLTLLPAEGNYTGEAQTVSVAVADGDTTLAEGTDYTCAWTLKGEKVSEIKATGDYTVTATGKGNYSFTATETFKMLRVAQTSALTITGTGTTKTYGDAAFEVTVGGGNAGTYGLASSNEQVLTVAPVTGAADRWTVTVVGAGEATLTATRTTTPEDDYENATPVEQTVGVAPKTLTVTVDSVTSKTYDGKLNAEGTLALGGVVDGDVIKAEGTFEWTSADAETTTVNVSEIKLIGEKKTNYTLAQDSLTGVTAPNGAKISKAANSWKTEPAANTLTYTGEAQALITAGETLVSSEIQYQLDDGEWGTAVPTATEAGTYTVKFKVPATANYSEIAEKSLTVKMNSKTITPTVTLSQTSAEWDDTATLSQIQISVMDGEKPIPSNEWTSDWDPAKITGKGDVKITVTDSKKNGGNYELSDASVTFSATGPQVWVSGIAFKGKTYDGTLDAELDETSTIALTGRGDVSLTYSKEDLDVEVTGKFDKKDAGERTVNLEVKLIGSKANDYVLATDSKQQTTATATITRKEVTVGEGIVAQNKVYDGTVNAALDCSKATITGKIAGDELSVSANGTFESKAASEDMKTVHISGLTLDGADAGNYVLAATGNQTEAAATITKATLTLTGVTATWDGTKVVFSQGTLKGLVAGDDVSPAFPEKTGLEPGTQKVPYTPTLTGADKDNYVLSPADYEVTVSVPQPETKVVEQEVVNTGADGAQVATTDTGTNGIAEAAATIAADETEMQKAKAQVTAEDLTSLGVDDNNPLFIAVQPVVTITKTDEGNFKVESEAQLYATTEAAAQNPANLKDTTKAIPLSAQPMKVTSAVKVKLPVNSSINEGSTAYVTQTVNGVTYEYEATVTNGMAEFEVPELSGANEFTAPSATSIAAFKIGDVAYDTLQKAVDAVNNGETIKVCTDSTDSAVVDAVINKVVSFTLDGTYTGTITAGSQFNLTTEGSVYTTTKKNDGASYSSGGSSSPAPAATETVATASGVTNGSVSYSNASAKAGEKQTVDAKPAAGYKLASITAKDAKGNDVPLTKNADGTYSFTMPADGSKVTVTPVFEKADAPQFTDVPANAFYADAVAWAVENNITNGKGAEDTFKPDDTCTRAEAVTFLYRAAGSPDVAVNSSFTDVSASSFYAKAVAWAVANGITNGTGDGTTFSPNEKCSRAQIVTFLFRFEKATTATSSFNDVAADAYYAGAVGWAVANGITHGTGDGTTFSPDMDCTRGQIVTFLYRDFVK